MACYGKMTGTTVDLLTIRSNSELSW